MTHNSGEDWSTTQACTHDKAAEFENVYIVYKICKQLNLVKIKSHEFIKTLKINRKLFSKYKLKKMFNLLFIEMDFKEDRINFF